MACYWLMMTSFGDDTWPSGSLGLLTDKKEKINPVQSKNRARPMAAWLIHVNMYDCTIQ